MRVRFSIRDIMLVTALVAIAACWWLDHHRLMAKHLNYQARLSELADGGRIDGMTAGAERIDWSDDGVDRIYAAYKKDEAEEALHPAMSGGSLQAPVMPGTHK